MSASYPPNERGEMFAAIDRHGGAGPLTKILQHPYRKERVVEETLGVVIAPWQEAEYGWLRVYLRDTGETLGWKQDGDGVFVRYLADHIDLDVFSEWSRRHRGPGDAFRASRSGGCKKLLRLRGEG